MNKASKVDAAFYAGRGPVFDRASTRVNMRQCDVVSRPLPERPMNLVPEVAALVPQMKAWRHHLHAHPETAFEERATGAFVAGHLRTLGLEVHTGLAGTGVVGVLAGGVG